MALTLSTGSVSATIDSDNGARLTSLRFGGAELLANNANPLTSGCYPMAPWCGRIRGARFHWQGATHTVPATDGAHALHGLVHATCWRTIDAGPASVTLRTELDRETWVARGSVTHTIMLADDIVRCELTVESDDANFPAQVGWHPCFAGARSTEFSFGSMYEREDDGITDGLLTEPSAGPWDDCFVGATRSPVVRWQHCEATITTDCDHWVIYDQIPGLTCVEPQSGPPNAFNHPARADDIEGFDVVSPGRPLTRWMEIRLTSPRSPLT